MVEKILLVPVLAALAPASNEPKQYNPPPQERRTLRGSLRQSGAHTSDSAADEPSDAQDIAAFTQDVAAEVQRARAKFPGSI